MRLLNKRCVSLKQIDFEIEWILNKRKQKTKEEIEKMKKKCKLKVRNYFRDSSHRNNKIVIRI